VSQRDVAVYHDERMRYAHCMILTGNLTSMDLMVVAYLVLGEACLIKSLGFPDFPGGLYGISLMLYRGFLFMPLLRVPLLVSPLLPIYGEHVGELW